MKRVVSNSELILLLSCVIFTARTSAELPGGVRNEFIAHRQRQRDTGLSARSRPIIGLDKPYDSLEQVSSVNWAGAVQLSPPSGTFNMVEARWTLPKVSRPPSAGGPGTWLSAEWVGIDGDTCTAAILQAGTLSSVNVNSSGAVTTSAVAWFEWYPDYLYTFPSFSVAAGDTVQVTVTAQSNSSGTVEVNNLSNGYSAFITLNSPSSSSQLCGRNAEWIVEDISINGGLSPFSSFTNVDFQNCVAGTTTGTAVNLNGAVLIDIVQNNAVLATPIVVSPSELEVYYGNSPQYDERSDH